MNTKINNTSKVDMVQTLITREFMIGGIYDEK